MIPPFDRMMTHEYSSFSAFPAVGEAGHLYHDTSTDDYYRFDPPNYVSWGGSGSGSGGSGGGHEILDADGTPMPPQTKLQFLNSVVTNGVGKTVIDLASFARPAKPSMVYPLDLDVGVPIAVRLKATEYFHPYNVPIAASQWQIATDAAFTSIVLDRRQTEAGSSTVVIVDGSSVPILSTNTTYYARVRYEDLRWQVSAWSDVVEFVTDTSAAMNTILQPDIMRPVDTGWTTEDRLVVQISQPQSIGTIVADKLDLQVSMTQAFTPLDLVTDVVDATNLELYDAPINLRTVPEPIYMRARHKGSGNTVISPWSSVPTVWIQRLYKELCIGVEMQIRDSGPIISWIDIDGNPISVPPSYFTNHPVFNGFISTSWTDSRATPITHDMVRVPPFYAHGDTVGTTVGVDLKHRLWISPVPENGDFHLHPAFMPSPTGFLVSAALVSGTGATDWGSRIGTAGSNVGRPNLMTCVNNIAASNPKVRAYNVHTRAALQLLALIEKMSPTINNFGPGSGAGNNAASKIFHNIYSFTEFGFGVCEGADVNIVSNVGALSIGAPANPSVLTVMNSISVPTHSTVMSIMSGFSSFLGSDLELYFIPETAGPGVITASADRYHNVFNNYSSGYYLCQGVMSETAGDGVGFIARMLGSSAPVYVRFIVWD